MVREGRRWGRPREACSSDGVRWVPRCCSLTPAASPSPSWSGRTRPQPPPPQSPRSWIKDAERRRSRHHFTVSWHRRLFWFHSTFRDIVISQGLSGMISRKFILFQMASSYLGQTCGNPSRLLFLSAVMNYWKYIMQQATSLHCTTRLQRKEKTFRIYILWIPK